MNIKDIVRNNLDNKAIQENVMQAIQQRVKNGWKAEKNRGKKHESMAAIGG